MKNCSVFATFLALLFLSFSFNGCTKGDDPAPDPTTTVEQDKAFITDITTQTNNCIKNARDGNLSQSIIQFLDLSNGVVDNEAWVNSMSEALEPVMGILELDPDNSRFNYSSYWGVYTWNKGTQTFTKTAGNGIFINFPSTPAQATNNVSIRFTEYTDGLYQANAKDIYLPKTAKASITKDNTIIADLNFSATYSNGNFPAPINVSFKLLLAPHSYDFSVERITSTQFKFKSDIFSGAGCGISLGATVSFNNDDYNNLAVEDDLKAVDVQYQSGDFIVKSNWDAKAYYLLNADNTDNLNSTLITSVYNKTEKIGDLKFKDVGNDTELFIYYKDGSSENTTVYYEPFLTNLKNTLRPMFGNDVDEWF